jgi:hypothetical protein
MSTSFEKKEATKDTPVFFTALLIREAVPSIIFRKMKHLPAGFDLQRITRVLALFIGQLDRIPPGPVRGNPAFAQLYDHIQRGHPHIIGQGGADAEGVPDPAPAVLVDLQRLFNIQAV